MEKINMNADASIELEVQQLTRAQLRLLGILPLGFFSVQFIHYWQIDQLGHVFWMCNIGNLLLALGLFFEQAILIRVAALWMVPGVAVWFAYVVPTWGLLLTGKFTSSELLAVISSTLAHLGGFCVGMVVMRRIRMDSRAWFYAFIWYLVMQLISRLATPVALNVNVSQSVQAGWEQTFSNYWKFWLVLTVLVGICLWLLGGLLRMLWPTPAVDDFGAPGD
ncbi:MAG: hypothetical protein ABJC10_09470 [Acidobacteriota bacterium]